MHVVFPEQLLKDIDAVAGARQRGTFLVRAAEKELLTYRQAEALKAAAGNWKEKDHPELKHGSAQFVRKLRQDSERRFKRITTR